MFVKITELISSFFFVLLILSRESSEQENKFEEITCADVKDVPVIGPIAVSTSNANPDKAHVDFYLSTRREKERVQIKLYDWTEFEKSGFDLSHKTIIIIHGYRSNGNKSWVSELKEKFLDTQNVNVIIVDWNQASYHKNYVSAARKTKLVSQKLFNFLQLMKHYAKNLNNISEKIQWNHLYFIGHSLGAHISGQTSYLLKQDPFWKVERITGLDPAKPCFVNTKSYLRIDKEDADFVDVIHTQVGVDNEFFTFGLRDSIGHMDFYVNGGAVQPKCISSIFNIPWNSVICSHKLVSRYFIESFSLNDTCSFVAYKWDKSYQDAKRILSDKFRDLPCTNCPEMGINAPNSNEKGNFLVITSTNEPYCVFHKKDYSKVNKAIEKIKH